MKKIFLVNSNNKVIKIYNNKSMAESSLKEGERIVISDLPEVQFEEGKDYSLWSSDADVIHYKERTSSLVDRESENIISSPGEWVDLGEASPLTTEQQYVESKEDQEKIRNAELEKKRNNASLIRSDFKLALLEKDDLDKIETALSYDNEFKKEKIIWEDAQIFKRMDNNVISLLKIIDYTEEDIDNLFGIY